MIDAKELLTEFYITHGDREFSLDVADEITNVTIRMKFYDLNYLQYASSNNIRLTPKAIALIKS